MQTRSIPAARGTEQTPEVINVVAGTINAFQVKTGPDLDIVHLMVENSTEVQMNTLFSAGGVDNFVKSDKKKLLPKMIKNYETKILRMTKQQPLTNQDKLHLSRWIRELGVLKEKLFRWALVAIEEDFTISFDGDQQQTDFDKADFLMYVATDRVHGKKLKQKDAEIKSLNHSLKMVADVVQGIKHQEQKKLTIGIKELMHLENSKEGGDVIPAQALIVSLQVQLQEARSKEKEISASLKQLQTILAQNKRTIQVNNAEPVLAAETPQMQVLRDEDPKKRDQVQKTIPPTNKLGYLARRRNFLMAKKVTRFSVAGSRKNIVNSKFPKSRKVIAENRTVVTISLSEDEQEAEKT